MQMTDWTEWRAASVSCGGLVAERWHRCGGGVYHVALFNSGRGASLVVTDVPEMGCSLWDPEAGRGYDSDCPAHWGWDEWDPDSRRSAQGNARLDAVGELVYDRFPEALEWVARELGWSVVAASDLGDELPEGALLMSSSGWEWEQGSPHATVLIPPASVSAA